MIQLSVHPLLAALRSGDAWTFPPKEWQPFQAIDFHLPFSVYASRFEKITDPEIVALALKLNQPRLLDATFPIANAEVTIAGKTIEFLDGIAPHEDWRKLGDLLQCLAEDLDGNALLTTWCSIDEFDALLLLVSGEPFEQLKPLAAQWREMGADVIYFDFYVSEH